MLGGIELTFHEQIRQILQTALEAHNGNKTQAAKSLGLKRSTYVEKLRRYGFTLNEPHERNEEGVKGWL